MIVSPILYTIGFFYLEQYITFCDFLTINMLQIMTKAVKKKKNCGGVKV